MVRCRQEVRSDRFDHKFGGDGFIVVDSLNTCDEELNNKGRVFGHTTLQPGSSIGYHVHNGESEIYYIIKGRGEFNDNGKVVPIAAGDVTYTFSSMGHGLSNTGKDAMEIIALILYA